MWFGGRANGRVQVRFGVLGELPSRVPPVAMVSRRCGRNIHAPESTRVRSWDDPENAPNGKAQTG
jgi:hypothetical protein